MKDTSSGGHDLGQLIRPFGDIGKGLHRPVGHLAASFGVIPKGTFLKDQLKNTLELIQERSHLFVKNVQNPFLNQVN